MSERPVVLVTGASRGLGAAIAAWLGRAGATVVLSARHSEGLDAVSMDVRRLGGEAHVVVADVGYAESCFDLVERTLERCGRLDAVVNNAGILEPLAPLERTNPEDWGRNLQINLLGPYYVTRYALPALRKSSGRLVNISSGAALRPIAGWSAYCVAKAGLLQMTRVVAAEVPEVVAVSLRPGVVDTGMQALIRQRGPEGMTPEQVDYFRSLKEEGRLQPPEIPARSAAWLALHAPREWSGELLEHDDPRLVDPAVEALGESLA